MFFVEAIGLTIWRTPQCTTGTYQLVATAAISISFMEGLLQRVRHIELCAKCIQIQMLVKKKLFFRPSPSRLSPGRNMLVKEKRLLLEHIPGLQNPSDGSTKLFKFREMLINLEKGGRIGART